MSLSISEFSELCQKFESTPINGDVIQQQQNQQFSTVRNNNIFPPKSKLQFPLLTLKKMMNDEAITIVKEKETKFDDDDDDVEENNDDDDAAALTGSSKRRKQKNQNQNQQRNSKKKSEKVSSSKLLFDRITNSLQQEFHKYSPSQLTSSLISDDSITWKSFSQQNILGKNRFNGIAAENLSLLLNSASASSHNDHNNNNQQQLLSRPTTVISVDVMAEDRLVKQTLLFRYKEQNNNNFDISSSNNNSSSCSLRKLFENISCQNDGLPQSKILSNQIEIFVAQASGTSSMIRLPVFRLNSKATTNKSNSSILDEYSLTEFSSGTVFVFRHFGDCDHVCVITGVERVYNEENICLANGNRENEERETGNDDDNNNKDDDDDFSLATTTENSSNITNSNNSKNTIINNKTIEPIQIFAKKVRCLYCDVCNSVPATISAYACRLCPSHPTNFCRTCYDLVHVGVQSGDDDDCCVVFLPSLHHQQEKQEEQQQVNVNG